MALDDEGSSPEEDADARDAKKQRSKDIARYEREEDSSDGLENLPSSMDKCDLSPKQKPLKSSLPPSRSNSSRSLAGSDSDELTELTNDGDEEDDADESDRSSVEEGDSVSSSQEEEDSGRVRKTPRKQRLLSDDTEEDENTQEEVEGEQDEENGGRNYSRRPDVPGESYEQRRDSGRSDNTSSETERPKDAGPTRYRKTRRRKAAATPVPSPRTPGPSNPLVDEAFPTEEYLDAFPGLSTIKNQIGTPYNYAKDIAPPENVLVRRLEAIEQMWLPAQSLHVGMCHRIVELNIGLVSVDTMREARARILESIAEGGNASGMSTPTHRAMHSLEDVNDAINAEVVTPCLNLRMQFLWANLIANPTVSKCVDFENRLLKIVDVQYHLCESFFNFARVTLLASGNDSRGIKQPSGLLRFIPRNDLAQAKPAFKLLMIALVKLKQNNLRRRDGHVWSQIFTSQNQATRAWKEGKSIKNWVYALVGNPDNGYAEFNLAFSNGDGARFVINVLENIVSPYFPELDFDRHQSSWKNGIFDKELICFTPYPINGVIQPTQYARCSWDDAAATRAQGDAAIAQKVRGEAADMRADAGRRDKTTDEFSHTPPVCTPPTTPMPSPQRHSAPSSPGQFGYEDGTPSQDQPHQQQRGPASTTTRVRKAKPTSSESCKYYDREFRFQWDGDEWPSIVTEAFDSILCAQDFLPVVLVWIYGMCGRSGYLISEYDTWQVALFLLGVAGTGKSTICMLFGEIYLPNDVGLISNNIEKKFSIAGHFNKRLVLAPEIKKDFSLNQAELQQAITGETMSGAVKNKDAVVGKFQGHIVMAGNEPAGWRDTSGSMQRRILGIEFTKPIPKAKLNPLLYVELLENFDLWLQKVNFAYRDIAAQYGHRDIWAAVPNYFKDVNRKMMQSMHPILGFFKDMLHTVEIGPEFFCPFETFVKKINQYCSANNLPMKNQAFDESFYRVPLSEYLVTVVVDRREVDGIQRDGKWVVGMRFVDNNDDEETRRKAPR